MVLAILEQAAPGGLLKNVVRAAVRLLFSKAWRILGLSRQLPPVMVSMVTTLLKRLTVGVTVMGKTNKTEGRRNIGVAKSGRVN